ncbi:uncharacterized protein [Clytia hemisphaerica]|uniref:uncharacterized protein n=1 Tax=Clytia hemisphaerica TaxID=252671 RepID=UPI0034D433C6|eukprot:TCONS_00059842-protein
MNNSIEISENSHPNDLFYTQQKDGEKPKKRPALKMSPIKFELSDDDSMNPETTMSSEETNVEVDKKNTEDIKSVFKEPHLDTDIDAGIRVLRFLKHKNVGEILSNHEKGAVKTEEKATQTEETMMMRRDFALLVKDLEKTIQELKSNISQQKKRIYSDIQSIEAIDEMLDDIMPKCAKMG